VYEPSSGDTAVSGRAFVPATLNSTAVVVKRITQRVLDKITQHEQALLRVKTKNILPYFALCMEPPSFVTLHMTNGAVDDWLYGARSRRRCSRTSTTGSGGNSDDENSKSNDDGGSETKSEGENEKLLDSMEKEPQQEMREGEGDGISDTQVAEWAVQLAAAISHLHTEKIVHSDIRCGNVLLDENMDIKLTGFLIHKPSEDYALASSCLHWEAPEAFRHEIQLYTKESDAYMFALTLYEMVVRGKPWGELTGKEVRVKVLDKQRPDLAPLDAWIERFSGADAIKSVVKKCWADSPTERMEVWEMGDVLQQMQVDCATMEQRKRKEVEEEEAAEQAVVEVEGSIMEEGVDQGQADDDDGNGPERERRELETAALMQSKNHLTTKELSRPHSYSAGEKLNRRASSPVMIRAGETLSLSTDKKNGGEGK